MFRLSFTLEQHSPMRLFQGEREGGITLRATEIKPKLDKYIRQQYCVDKPELNTESLLNGELMQLGWIVNEKQANALNYRMTFKHTKPLIFVRTIGAEKNQPVVLFPEVKGTIISPNKHLIEKIKTSIEDFFIIHNFGRTTSKGFGAFYVKELDNRTIDLNANIVLASLKSHYANERVITLPYSKIEVSRLLNITVSNEAIRVFNRKNTFQFDLSIFELNVYQALCYGEHKMKLINDFNSKLSNKIEELNTEFNLELGYNKKNLIIENISNRLINIKLLDVLDFISFNNRIIKSGLNFGEYKKSLLFLTFIKKSIVWEKRFIKTYLRPLLNDIGKDFYWSKKEPSINEIRNGWRDSYNANDFKFIRILLGLPELYEFQLGSFDGVKEFGKTKEENAKLVVRLFNKNIERYKSPIFYKIFNNTVFICLEKINHEILGKEFIMSASIMSRVGQNWVETNHLSINDNQNHIMTPTNEDLGEVKIANVLQTYFENKW